MTRFTPAGVPIYDCDAFGWRMQNGMLQSPSYIAQRGYDRGFRDGSMRGGGGGGSGGGSSDTSWQQALSGLKMPAKPSVSAANDAIKTVWTKLGGTVVSCFAALLSFGASVETAPLGTLNEDSNVVVRVEFPDTPGEIAAATNAVLTAANAYTDGATNATLVAANAYTDGATNATLAAANAYTDEHSGTDPEAVRGIVREELGPATNGLRSVMDNVSRVSEPGLWYRGPVDWAGTEGSELEPQPSFSGSSWTWNVLGSEGTARFKADGNEDSVRLTFHGAGVVSPAAKFYAGLATGAALSNETFVTSSFVTNRVAAGTASIIPGMRDLLSKTNATEISDSFETNSIVGRLANDSIGFEVRGKILAFMDGDVDIWTCESGGGGSGGGGVDTNAVRDIVREEIGPATNGLRRVEDLKVYEASLGRWEANGVPEGLVLDDQPYYNNDHWSWNVLESPPGIEEFSLLAYVGEDAESALFIGQTVRVSASRHFVGYHPTSDQLRTVTNLDVYDYVFGPITINGLTATPVDESAEGIGWQMVFIAPGAESPSANYFDGVKSGDTITFLTKAWDYEDRFPPTPYTIKGTLAPTGDHLAKESQVTPLASRVDAVESSVSGLQSSKRDKTDAKCYEDVFTPWVAHDVPEGITLRGQPVFTNPGWSWDAYGIDYTANGDESATELNFENLFTATRAKVAVGNETFITESFVTSRLLKVRAALDLLPASPSVSDLVNALKTALEE